NSIPCQIRITPLNLLPMAMDYASLKFVLINAATYLRCHRWLLLRRTRDTISLEFACRRSVPHYSPRQPTVISCSKPEPICRLAPKVSTLLFHGVGVPKSRNLKASSALITKLSKPEMKVIDSVTNLLTRLFQIGDPLSGRLRHARSKSPAPSSCRH